MNIEHELEMLEEIAVKKLEGVAAMRGTIHDYRNILNTVDAAMHAVNRAQRAIYVAHEKLVRKD
jgi:hypothetical protein